MIEFDVELQDNHTVKCWFLDDEGTARWMDRLRGYSEIRMGKIGNSRGGRPMHGLMVGHGPAYMSITAGAHADEPAGPMTACLLAEWLAGTSKAAGLLREHLTFIICPQVNPDGAEVNKEWFAPVPDFETYLRRVKREGPGDDIEFGYPDLRPENVAVTEFLKASEPYVFHASLHSMAFAEGAWMLLEKSLAAKQPLVRKTLALLLLQNGFKLHDINRRGEKGFSRIEPGFCTTPTGDAMDYYFRKRGEDATAELFLLSSMELIQVDSPDAFIMVTELPIFSICGGYVEGRELPESARTFRAPNPGSTNYEKFRDQLKSHIAAGDYAGAVDLSKQYDLEAVPFEIQCRTQLEIIKTMGKLLTTMMVRLHKGRY